MGSFPQLSMVISDCSVLCIHFRIGKSRIGMWSMRRNKKKKQNFSSECISQNFGYNKLSVLGIVCVLMKYVAGFECLHINLILYCLSTSSCFFLRSVLFSWSNGVAHSSSTLLSFFYHQANGRSIYVLFRSLQWSWWIFIWKKVIFKFCHFHFLC